MMRLMPIKALIYKYARTVKQNDSRSVEDNSGIYEWLKSMPPQPIDKSSLKGFKQGAASEWMKKVNGDNHVPVLE